ncbi:nucleoside-diphosphate-sugar epimerase [Sulfuritortus calidifontis]|uniref:Nucleoside-diphosphate-sugar epimerase n=1 Tax=Sulfuritortus calidifontis TaxID=1914471 RepID=A0A4R3K0D5_9PROT|nr:SDR family oxidoreductase [Sulfuritortus calidifontis]TCS73368.1 nucleoside-diphosphate-sugar epimerase [Sulfuritortus calidifontis]
MLRILIIGCGDIGLRIARQLQGRARLYALSRSPDSRARLRAAGITPIAGDLDDRHSLKRLAGLADWVLHLAPPPGEGTGDPRTVRLLAALGRGSLPRALAYISTTGVYGDCAGAWVPETRPARPHNARAKRRVAAERVLRGWGRAHGVRVAILRAPGIYAAGRLPGERVRRGLPALLPEEDIYTNHIHADDLARLCVTALLRGRANRLYNAVDDSGHKMGDWFDLVADHLGLPRPPRLPRAEVEAAVTPAMRSFLSESRRLSNRRIKDELRFRLRYPTVQAGLAAI